MDITEVKVFPVSEEKLKAFVSIVFDQCFMVNDIKIIQGRQGLFISMPSRRKKNGEFKDVAHPLNNDTRRFIEERILDEYERVLEARGEPAPKVQRREPPGEAAAAKREKAPPRPAPVPTPAAPSEGEAASSGPPREEEAAETAAAAASAGPPARDGFDPAARPAGGNGAEVARPAAAATAGTDERKPEESPETGADEETEEERSLEEVQEIHLRDSFWTVP